MDALVVTDNFCLDSVMSELKCWQQRKMESKATVVRIDWVAPSVSASGGSLVTRNTSYLADRNEKKQMMRPSAW